MRRFWSSLLALLRLTFVAAPGLVCVELLLVVATAMAGPMQSHGAAQVVDAVLDQGSILPGVLVLFTALLVTFGGLVGSEAVRHRLEDEVEFALQKELLGLATAPSDIAHHEDRQIADQLGAVQEEFRRIKGTAGAIAGGLAVLVSTGTVLALLATVHVLLLLLPLLGLLRLWAAGASARRSRDAVTRSMEYTRRYKRLMEIARTPQNGLEVRAAGFRGPLTERVCEIAGLQNVPRWRAAWYGGLLEASTRFILGLGYGAAIIFVLWLAQVGRVTGGEVMLVVLLAPQTDRAAERLAASVSSLVAMYEVVRNVQSLRSYVAARCVTRAAMPPPRQLREGIDLVDVSFKYPGSDRWSLHRVTTFLPAGSTIALVGGNGAGKTTLVKLLTGLYELMSGRILVDGIDLQDVLPEAWRQQISAGFQDFVRYEYTAREAIGLGDPALLGSAVDDAIYEAAINASDAREVINSLPDGLSTRLGRQFGGTELSGGQWQRLALARAFQRSYPTLVVLDEPASSLDPESEHALIDRFNKFSAKTRENGGITLLVSHRLSTVRMADQILVLDGGLLVESGRHQELMAAGGLYAELFELQARAYR